MRKMIQRHTMKWKILEYNIFVVIGFMVLTTVVFNFAIRFYLEKDIENQLHNITMRVEDTALHKGSNFLSKPDAPPPKKPGANSTTDASTPGTTTDATDANDSNSKNSKSDSALSDEMYKFYFMLDRSLTDTMSVLNADYILIDTNKSIINTSIEGYFSGSEDLLNKITTEFNQKDTFRTKESYLNFSLSGTDYIAIVKSVSDKNSFGLGWIVIYSSLQNINQLQLVINVILLIILVLLSLVSFVLSSLAAKKISAPFSSLNQHLSEIAERNFCVKLDLPVDDELKEFVKNINIMSQKLETYDNAQKTFLQNASHEFRTPLMSIQSYAEGIKYEVIDKDTAVSVILEETKRMTNLVGDLMYLSRLNTIEESYHFKKFSISSLINSCVDHMHVIAKNNNINLLFDASDNITVYADEEKLSRAITNIISNDIRYAKSTVKISLKVSDTNSALIHLSILDDGPGFDTNELSSIFDRFYKGKKGNFGLGLAIAKNVIEKHNGRIYAENSEYGALFVIELPILKEGL